jgi:hypothetical protein
MNNRNGEGPRPAEAIAADHGGLMGELIDGVRDRQSLRLIGQAVNQRWPIPEEVRRKLGAVLGDIALHADNARTQVLAASILVKLDGLNWTQEKLEAGLPDRRVEHTHGHAHAVDVLGLDKLAEVFRQEARRLEEKRKAGADGQGAPAEPPSEALADRG